MADKYKPKVKEYKPTDVSRREGESDERYYHRLAKVADQRLLRLERYSHDDNFKTATKWAYNKAIKDIESWTGENSRRFNTAAPTNKRALQAKTRDIIQFLQSETSTKTGIINVYKKRADTINQKYGTNLTWQELGSYFQSSDAEKNDKMYGSKTALKAYGVIKKNKKQIQKSLENKKKYNDIQYVDDDIVNDVVNSMIKKKGMKLFD